MLILHLEKGEKFGEKKNKTFAMTLQICRKTTKGPFTCTISQCDFTRQLLEIIREYKIGAIEEVYVGA
jgi:hypothetical protein